MIENMISLDYLIHVYYLFYIYTEVQMPYLGYHFSSKLCKFSNQWHVTVIQKILKLPAF